MTEDNEYYEWLEQGGRIRVSARAIILRSDGKAVLVERNAREPEGYSNFLGGGVAVGETLLDCILRELQEEVEASVVSADYLFAVENLFEYQGERRHSLEHYFRLVLKDDRVTSKLPGLEYRWVPRDELPDTDLRPHAVRDRLATGTLGGSTLLRAD